MMIPLDRILARWAHDSRPCSSKKIPSETIHLAASWSRQLWSQTPLKRSLSKFHLKLHSRIYNFWSASKCRITSYCIGTYRWWERTTWRPSRVKDLSCPYKIWLDSTCETVRKFTSGLSLWTFGLKFITDWFRRHADELKAESSWK